MSKRAFYDAIFAALLPQAKEAELDDVLWFMEELRRRTDARLDWGASESAKCTANIVEYALNHDLALLEGGA